MAKANRGSLYVFGGWELDLGRGEMRLHGHPVPIGGRSFEIVEVLVLSAGQLVTKDELMRQVWPGAFVEENTLQVHISAVRRALGVDRGLLKTVTGRGYRLQGDWRLQDSSRARMPETERPTPQPVVSNLPLGRSDLIGRSIALNELQALVTAYRTVTLTGPGGIGKTALALEVARRLLPDFPGDIRLIELVSLTDPGLVPSAVVGILNLKLGPEAVTPTAVARAIGDRRLLLVFDNCEHVVDAVAELAETMMRLCPHVSILATSRELLRIDGEYAYRVPPLDVPAEQAQAVDELRQHSAVQLFIARVRALRSTFLPREDEIQAIAAACRRLDGIPLAIEFAAARAAALGVSHVLSSLDDLFGSLTSGRRTALPRHQTLRATLDWSYELLPAQEQRLLRHLAIFAGGFTLEAAAAIQGEPANPATTAADVASLVGKSLISLDQFGTDSRWRLLETTRSYALEKLAHEGERERTASRHAAFFRDLVLRKPKGAPLGGSFAIYGKEVGNVRAALDWAFSPGGDVAVGAVLAAAYAPVWFYLSSMGECGQQVERALSKLADDSHETARLRMQLYIALGLVLAYTVAMEEKTQIVLTKALRIAEQLNDVESELLTIWSLWNLRGKNGDHRESVRLARQFLHVSSRSSEPVDMLVGERLVGTALHFRGRQPAARHHLESVLERYTAPTSEQYSNWYLYDLRMVTRALLARVLLLQGFVKQAESSAQESLTISLSLNSNLSACYALRYAVISVALATNDLVRAEDSIAMLTDYATRYNFSPFLKQGRYLKAMLSIKRGEFATATEFLLTSLEENIKEGWSLCYPEALSVLAQGYAGLGNFTEAFRTIERALDWSDRTGERWCDSELFRTRAMLALADPGSRDDRKAEQDLIRAISVARYQGALLWELKASTDLARLKIQQGRQAEAGDLLAPVYARFTEGFEIADLRLAAEILEEVS